MAKPKSKATIKKKTIEDMKALGVYKESYNKMVEIYSEIVEQYNRLTLEFEENGYKYEVSTDQGGTKKSPIVATLETLRKDILAYSDRLCLNPKAIENVTTTKKKKSALAEALQEMNE